MTVRLYLVGTAHYDLKGEERLGKTLSVLNPDIVTAEALPDMIEAVPEDAIEKLVDQYASKEDEQLRPLLRKFLITQNFEVRVSHRYAEEHGIPYIPIEDQKLWETAGARLDEVDFVDDLIRDVIRAGTVEAYQREIDEEYMMMRARYDSGEIDAGLVFMVKRDVVGRRDEEKAIKLREILAGHPGKIVAHVGGFGHFLDAEGYTIYPFLKDLDPQRVLISELE